MSYSIGPYQVHAVTRDALISELSSRLQAHTKTLLFFANTNFVVKCTGLAAQLADPSVLIVNDGIGMDLACWALHRRRFQENLNGTDFVPALLQHSARPLRVFLYGARPEVVAQAAQVIEQRLKQQVVGQCSGYHEPAADVPGLIAQARPDVVLVAMGNPLQEQWILDHAAQLPGSLYIGVGALFDFLAGRASRAPMWVRKLRLEWFYRLCREPRRLGRRYTVDIVTFFRISLSRTSLRKRASLPQ